MSLTVTACVDRRPPTSPESAAQASATLSAVTITHSLLTAGHDPNNVRVYTTASISPLSNALVTVAVLTHQSSSAAPAPTLTGGGMAAWDLVATVAYNGATPLDRVSIYRAMSASPGSGPITITSSVTLSNCQWIVSQWQGVEASGTNGAGAIVQTGSAIGSAVNGLTVFLASFANPADVAYGVFGIGSATPIATAGSGFTRIDEQPSGEGTIGDVFAEWTVSDNTIDASWSNKSAGALGVEIKAGGGGGGGGGVSAALSTVAVSPGSITAGSGTSTVTVTAKDANGNPVSGAKVVLAATGTGNTLTQPASSTDAGGVATGTLSSTVTESKTISATIDGIAITQTAIVTVTEQTATGAITHTLLTSGNNSINQRAYTTGSISPAPNALITVVVLMRRSSGALSPTLSGGGMTAWDVVASADFDTQGTPTKRLTIFRAMSSSPGSGPITISFPSSASNVQWMVSQWDGVPASGTNGSGAIGQTGAARSDGATSLTVPLAAFASASDVAYGVVGVARNGPIVSPGSAFAEIGEVSSGENSALEAEWAANQPTVSASWTTSTKAGLLAVEIKAMPLPPSHPQGTTISSVPLANNPWGARISSQGLAYVTRPHTDSVGHIDLAGPTVLASFRVGNRPDDIWFNASGVTAYVTNLDDHTVGVINTATSTQTKTYAVAGGALRVLLGPGETTLYVTLDNGTVAVLDAASGAVVTTLVVATGPVNGIAMDPGGTRVYVSATSGTVTEIATASRTITRTFTLGGEPQDVAVSSDGNTLYTANEAGWVEFRDLQTGARTDSIPVPAAFGLALTPDEAQLWVSQSAVGALAVVDIATRTLTSITTLGTPRHIAFTPDGRTALVANEAGAVHVIR